LEFQKSGQLFIRKNNKAFPICAMRVSNEDCSPVGIHGCNAAPTQTGFAEIVGNNFPKLHAMKCASFALHTAMTKSRWRTSKRAISKSGSALVTVPKRFRFLNAE
jgi:hypothetical protein